MKSQKERTSHSLRIFWFSVFPLFCSTRGCWLRVLTPMHSPIPWLICNSRHIHEQIYNSAQACYVVVDCFVGEASLDPVLADCIEDEGIMQSVCDGGYLLTTWLCQDFADIRQCTNGVVVEGIWLEAEEEEENRGRGRGTWNGRWLGAFRQNKLMHQLDNKREIPIAIETKNSISRFNSSLIVLYYLIFSCVNSFKYNFEVCWVWC